MTVFRLILFWIILFPILAMGENNAFSKPDFAFPKQVETSALAKLKTAISKQDGQLAIRAIIDYGIASTSIDNDNTIDYIEKIRYVIQNKNDDCTRALLNLLLAKTYQNIYNGNRWTYDNRQLPDLPPSDIYQWSGKHFQMQIVQLLDSALSCPKQLQLQRLTKYQDILKADRVDYTFYPTLYDFIAHHAIDMIDALENEHNLFPSEWLCPLKTFQQLNFDLQSANTQRVLSLYSALLQFHAEDTAPFIRCEIDRISYITRHTYGYENGHAFDLYITLYNHFKDSEYSSEALIAAWPVDNLNHKSTLYRFINNNLKKFPEYIRNNNLKNIANEISREHIVINSNKTVVPGDTLHLYIDNQNARSYSINIYRIDNWDGKERYYGNTKKPLSYTLTQSIKCKTDSILPFITKSQHPVVLNTPGCYIIVPILDGQTFLSNKSYNYVFCTDLMIRSANYANDQWGFVINPKDGKPIENATLLLKSYNTSAGDKKYTTNVDGTAIINGQGRLLAEKGNDRYAHPAYINRGYSADTTLHYAVHGFTDLAIYHPGDTVNWSIIAQNYRNQKMHTASNIDIKVILRDANHQIIDSTTVYTDDYGRCKGQFTLPDNQLTGQYYLQYRNPKSQNGYGITRFTVSDYKLPTFQVTTTNLQRNIPKSGDVTISCKAETFSGFPIINGNVNISLSVAQRKLGWWHVNSSYKFFSTTTTTNQDGSFVINFTDEILKSAPITNGLFTADITVTAATGESQETTQTFTIGQSYFIEAAIPDAIDVCTPFRPDVRVVNTMGEAVLTCVNYSIIDNNNHTIKIGHINSQSSLVDWSGIEGGEYDIQFYLNNPTQADTVTVNNVALYRPSDKMPPVKAPLWIPTKRYSLDEDLTASILYGTSSDTAYIHYAIYSDSTFIKQGWMSVKAGMHYFKYKLPNGINSIDITFSSTSEYQNVSQTVSAIASSSINGIKLSIESFRDKITPGAKESWTFSVKDNSGNGLRSAMILNMYNKALDKIKKHTLHLYPTHSFGNNYELNAGFGLGFNYNATSSEYHQLRPIKISLPQYQTWGYSIGFGNAHKEEFIVTESARDLVMTSNTKNAIGATPMMTKSRGFDDIENEEESQSDSGSGNNKNEPNANDFQYRDSEVTLAFFEPMLTTDANGRLEYAFTTPDANTTWQLYALAFDKRLTTGSLAKEIIANKPIMVQPNLPRFIRNGDHCTLNASVMNNSDSLIVATTTIEIFNPINGHIISLHQQCDSIDSKQSALAIFDLIAPYDDNMIGYRIKSTTGSFTDGEQTIIPVLTTIAPVIEATTFYLPAKTGKSSIELAEIPNDALVTLEFCENPTWYVATALPGFISNQSNDAISSAVAIFSVAVADGVLRDNPEIRRALYRWQHSDKNDSTLVSMLQRNQDLKQALLSSTPWMMDAQSDTERMTRLALLFDRREIDIVTNRAIENLKKLQQSNGGWAWTAKTSEASEWVTLRILNLMGRLKQLNYLPVNNELEAMIEKGITYIDSLTATRYRKNPKGNYLDYTYIRDYYPETRLPSINRQIIDSTIQHLVSAWKSLDIHGKAIAAIILNNNHYSATARQVIESLREYSTYSPKKGMWWPSLDNLAPWSIGKVTVTSAILNAFHSVDPKSNDIDLIRQWLILQKEAMDWGTSIATSEVIATILKCGSKWIKPATGTNISINGFPIIIDKIDSDLGYFRKDISSITPSKATIDIVKYGDTPSWGAVYSQYDREQSLIKANNCNELSITKSLYQSINSDKGTTWQETDSFNIGDRVQVNLTIIANRDIDYITIIDERAACFEPVEQLPQPIIAEGIYFYRENNDASTNIFVTHLPKGIYRLSYELFTNNSGIFSSGIATIQSQYAPALTAHSSGGRVIVK